MKICIISGLYHPYAKGGAEAVAAEAAAEFSKVGHEVFVITARPFAGVRSLIPEVANENGIKVYRFFPLNIFFYGNIGKHNFWARLFWHLMDIWNIHAFLSVSKILKKIRPDVVLTHNIKGFGLILPSTLISARREHDLAYKWIHTLHDVQLVAPSGLLRLGEQNKWSHKIYSILTRALFCSPDAVISPSKWLLDFYVQRGFFPNSVKKVIPNPISGFRVQGSGFRDKNNFKFIYLGQLEKHKGVLFLLGAWKRFNLKYQNTSLTIAGTGSLLSEVVKKASDIPSVNVMGEVSHSKIAELFTNHDATIVPSLVYENAPSVILESLSYGVPVLASRIGGIPEMVEEGVNGWLFDPGNTESLISAMEKIVSTSLPALTPQHHHDYVSEILFCLRV